jgi:hypothetical protein
MRSAKSIGRLIGMLLFVQLVGLSLPFILLTPITTSGFLENAAGISFQIKVAVFLLFANAALTVGIAIGAFPVIREYSERVALWFVAISVIWFVMQAIDNAHIMSMLSLSQQYADGGADAGLYQALGSMLRSTRKWVHYTELLVIDTWFFVFYGLLFRFALVPRTLAIVGLIAVVIHLIAIPLPMFLGYPSVMPMLGISLAVSHIVVGTWLVVKGFGEQPPRGTDEGSA